MSKNFKPHIWREDEIWRCLGNSLRCMGFGHTALEAYADWVLAGGRWRT